MISKRWSRFVSEREFGRTTLAALTLLLSIFATPVFADNWIKAETDNFIVYSNNNANVTEEYIKNVEQFRYVLSAFHMNAEQRALAPPKLEIYLVRSQRDFKEVWPEVSERVAGFVSQCNNGIFAFSHYAGSTSEDELSGLHIFFHEYAHLFMFQNTRTAFPRWYIEGFAEFYASTKIRDDQVVVGKASRARYLTLARNVFRVKYEDILRDGDDVQLGNDEESFFLRPVLATNPLFVV